MRKTSKRLPLSMGGETKLPSEEERRNSPDRPVGFGNRPGMLFASVFLLPSFPTIADDRVVEMIPFVPLYSTFWRVRQTWSGRKDTCG